MKKLLLPVLFLTLCSVWTVAQTTVTFAVDMNNVETTELGVHLAGNVQSQIGDGSVGDWTPGGTPMVDNNEDGIYELTVTIPAGEYQYKFINGNDWGGDEGQDPADAGSFPSGLADCGVNNGVNDGHNRSLMVGDEEMVVAVTFNSCTEIADFVSEVVASGLGDLSQIKETMKAAPNPFVDRTTITYATIDGELSSLKVYDLVGQLVKVLVNEVKVGGEHSISWDGTSDNGARLPTGQYFYVLETQNEAIAKRIMLVR